jgi:hypothetical protein
MYFAIEAAYASLPASICQEFSSICSTHIDQALHLFALVDGAFDEAMTTGRDRSRLPRHSLYETTSLEALGAAAPHLLVAPIAISEQPQWLEKLFTACTGKPMLSVIASALSAEALQQHLCPYLIAQTPDGMEWPLRWGDTRVLPELMQAVDESQYKHLLSPLYYWWSVNRDGTLLSWQGKGESDPVGAEFDKLPLNDVAFARLVDAAEADAVLANLYDSQFDVLQLHRPTECHARVAKHLALASQYRIEAASDRQHFCMLALCLTKDFAKHPAMTALLEHTRQGLDYSSEVAALPPNFWQETAP